MGRKIDVATAGRIGGLRAKERHGREFYSRIGKMGVAVQRQLPDFYKKLSRFGVEARKKKRAERSDPTIQLASVLTGEGQVDIV